MEKDKMDLNILIVDDDIETLEISKELLSKFVKKVFVADNIKDVKKYSENFMIDVLVTNTYIKGAKGCEIISNVKEHQAEVYAILISSFGSDFINAKEEIARLGITRFLTKPFKVDILLNMLSEINTLKKTKHYYQSLQDTNSTLENEILNNSKLLEDKNYIISSQSRYVVLGEMFSMVMHQLMQPVQAIKMISSIFKYKADKDTLDKNFIIEQSTQMMKSCDFLADTILSFRNFHKTDKIKDETTLKDIIDETLKLIQINLEKHYINIKIFTKDTLPIISIYKNELIQVILNLVNNAKDALILNKIENPTIIIETKYENGKHIIIVSDNAGGVPKNIQSSIFKANFTTKTHHGGTGLGLYMSKMIVESSLQGSIKLKNTNDGASFIIEI